MVRRRSFFDEIEEMFERFKRLFEEREKAYGLGGLGFSSSSMYSITVTYDHYGRPVVRVFAKGDINRSEVEGYLRERYPNAKIIWEGEDGKSHVRLVEDSHVKETSIQERSDLKLTKKSRGAEIVELDFKKPRIYELKVEGEKENEDKKWYDIKIE